MLLLLAACAHHIPEPADPAAALSPPAEPAPGLTVCPVEYATGKLPKGLVVARGAVKDDVTSTASGLLLIHPKGTWLVDGGYAADFQAHIREIRGFVGFAMRQSAKDWVTVATPDAAVRARGVDPASLAGLVPSHGHYDHLGGLLDLPNVPVWLPQAEIADANEAVAGHPSGVLPAEARALLPRAHPIAFDGPAVGPWSSSWDLFGDGSVRIVPMPGHTPGSVGTLITLADGRRILHVGDTVWVREGYEAREPKSLIAGAFDADRDATDQQIQRLWQLHRADPSLIIVPAHDRRQWEAAFPGGECAR